MKEINQDMPMSIQLTTFSFRLAQHRKHTRRALLMALCLFLICHYAAMAQAQTKKTESNEGTDKNLAPVYDLDSNKYNIIKIGKQYWFRENLRTTKYNDSSSIATGLSNTEWSQTKAGAYAVYDNNPLYEAMYGKLYNGYAVNSGRLCPKNWRVATDKDWNELELLLGVPASELERTGERGNMADKLKAKGNWNESAYSASNESGFSLQPGGARLDNGEYGNMGQYGNFWTSTVYDDRYGLLYLWNHHTHYNSNAVGRIYTKANNGYSCRCVKDIKAPAKK